MTDDEAMAQRVSERKAVRATVMAYAWGHGHAMSGSDIRWLDEQGYPSPRVETVPGEWCDDPSPNNHPVAARFRRGLRDVEVQYEISGTVWPLGSRPFAPTDARVELWHRLIHAEPVTREVVD